jgi:hypothetical protein
MLRSRRWMWGALAAFLLAGTCYAEDTEPSKVYKLEFVVKEVDGSKVVNSRTYSTMVSRDSTAEIRAGSKVPYVSETGGSGGTQYQQIDIGVSIDAKILKEAPDRLEFALKLETSSIAKDPSPQGHPVNPIIRQNSWSATVALPLKKATTVSTSDDVDAKTQTQLQVTATLVP